MPAPLEARGRVIHHAAFAVAPPPRRIALANWRPAEGLPGVPPRASRGPWPHRVTKGLAEGSYIGLQAVDTHQERAGGGPAAHARDAAPTQPPGAGGAHLASQPPSRPDHPGQRPPAKAALVLNTDRRGLDLSQVTRRLPQQRVDGRPLPARSRQPIRPRPLLKAAGRHNRLGRPPRREPGDDHHPGCRRGAQPVATGAGWGGEGLAALPAAEPFGLPRMAADRALAWWTAGRALQSGAEYGAGVRDESPRLAWRERRPSGKLMGPRCS
jgi:hypothetical protein